MGGLKWRTAPVEGRDIRRRLASGRAVPSSSSNRFGGATFLRELRVAASWDPVVCARSGDGGLEGPLFGVALPDLDPGPLVDPDQIGGPLGTFEEPV